MDAKKKETMLSDISMGLHAKGLVMSKNIFSSGNGDIHTVDIAIKGSKCFLSLGVSAERYHLLEELTPYNGFVSISEYKGKTYFSEAA